MTQAEQILSGVRQLLGDKDNEVFSREAIRQKINVSREIWDASYSPTFQAMRSDQPGGAPAIAEKYKNIFRQVAHGKHTLTDNGLQVIHSMVSLRTAKDT